MSMSEIVAIVADYPSNESGADAVEIWTHPRLGSVAVIRFDLFEPDAPNGAGTAYIWLKDGRICLVDTESGDNDFGDVRIENLEILNHVSLESIEQLREHLFPT